MLKSPVLSVHDETGSEEVWLRRDEILVVVEWFSQAIEETFGLSLVLLQFSILKFNVSS